MGKSIENLNTVFDSFYKFIVGIGLFIMVTPYILLWFFTYMHSKVNEVSNFTINNYGYITATSS